MQEPQACMFKMPETGRYCGAVATRQTAVNEDPWGRGYWCDDHAPASAVSVVVLDPNIDHRVAASPVAMPAEGKLSVAEMFADSQPPKQGE